jgi:ADP-ribosylation factor-like protein 8
VLDAGDESTFESAKKELHLLISKESLKDIPLLILSNKNDLPNAIDVDKTIQVLDLDSIKDREVSCYSISVKEAHNLNSVLSWLIARSKK